MPEARQTQQLMRDVARKADHVATVAPSSAEWAYAAGVRDALDWASGRSVPSSALSTVMARRDAS